MVGTAVQRIAHCDEAATMAPMMANNTMMNNNTIMNMSNSTSSGSGEDCDSIKVDVAVTLALMVGILMVSVC